MRLASVTRTTRKDCIMLYLATIDQLPIDADYRVLAYDCAYWNGLSLIETKLPIDGLDHAPETYPNGVSTSPEGCIAPWEKKEAPILPDLEKAVADVNMNANARPVETLQELLKQAPLDNAVNLYNCDGTIRVEKVLTNG